MSAQLMQGRLFECPAGYQQVSCRLRSNSRGSLIRALDCLELGTPRPRVKAWETSGDLDVFATGVLANVKVSDPVEPPPYQPGPRKYNSFGEVIFNIPKCAPKDVSITLFSETLRGLTDFTDAVHAARLQVIWCKEDGWHYSQWYRWMYVRVPGSSANERTRTITY